MSRPRAYAAIAHAKRSNPWEELQQKDDITCIRCGQDAPRHGSVKFHSCLVCANCVKRLQTLECKNGK